MQIQVKIQAIYALFLLDLLRARTSLRDNLQVSPRYLMARSIPVDVPFNNLCSGASIPTIRSFKHIQTVKTTYSAWCFGTCFFFPYAYIYPY